MLKKFLILDLKDDVALHVDEVAVLLNINQIVSLKPIRININESLVDGFWIRMSNGKKYKATQVPAELVRELQSTDTLAYELPDNMNVQEDFMH